MKILWFTSTPSNAAIEFGDKEVGCGWISALESIVVQSAEHELGLCFLYEGTEFKKITKNKVTYYGIPMQKTNGVQRIINRQLGRINDEYPSGSYDEVISEFKPDIIHVFGTENGYGKILVNKFDKVIFHLQGLVAPYYGVYFPPKISKWKALFKDSFNNQLRGLTYFHNYNIFNRRVKRETDMIKHWKYFSGRTDFDRNYVELLNPSATYFHCEELLRQDFFTTLWHAPAINAGKKKIVIGTTIQPNIYKGLDLIYSVLPLLKDFDIEWNIFGITESSALNAIVKKTLKISQPNKSIIFHGSVSAAKLLAELQKCHLFVHPSYIDNSPNSVCEAMLLGMPVLCSSVGGIKSLITNGKNGYLFNPQDRYDLAGLLVHVINNYELAIQSGYRARKIALQRHDSEKIYAVINEIYKEIKHS